MNNLIANVVRYLQLQIPYKIIMTPSIGGNVGEYTYHVRKGFIVKHVIRVSLDKVQQDVRSLRTLIVHELIHAWQTENCDYAVEHHGKEFRKMAKKLEKRFGIKNLYLKGIDV